MRIQFCIDLYGRGSYVQLASFDNQKDFFTNVKKSCVYLNSIWWELTGLELSEDENKKEQGKKITLIVYAKKFNSNNQIFSKRHYK